MSSSSSSLSSSIPSILFVKDSDGFLLDGACEVQSTTLMHPNGQPCMFLCHHGDLYELQSSQLAKYSSWFVNNQVVNRQSFLLANKVDPRFLCLPYFERFGSKFSPLDQILVPSTSEMAVTDPLPLVNHAKWKLDKICDINDKFDDMVFYRLNETKVLAWLTSKVERLSVVIRQRKRSLNQRQNPLFSSNFNLPTACNPCLGTELTTTTTTTTTLPEDIVDAAQMVCDYLTPSMSRKLIVALKLNENDVFATAKVSMNVSKRKADWELDLEMERETEYKPGTTVTPLVQSMTTTATVAASTVAASTTTHQNKLPSKKPVVGNNALASKKNVVAAVGTKGIQSFFTKK